MGSASTKLERLRMVAGSVLALAGVITLVIVGAFYGYTNEWVWIVGLLLVVGDVLTAKSPALVQFLQDITK